VIELPLSSVAAPARLWFFLLLPYQNRARKLIGLARILFRLKVELLLAVGRAEGVGHACVVADRGSKPLVHLHTTYRVFRHRCPLSCCGRDRLRVARRYLPHYSLYIEIAHDAAPRMAPVSGCQSSVAAWSLMGISKTMAPERWLPGCIIR
jgi:hypothetical protein